MVTDLRDDGGGSSSSTDRLESSGSAETVLVEHADVASSGGTVQLDPEQAYPTAFVRIVSDAGELSTWELDGAGGVNKVDDPGGSYTTGSGTSGTTNLYDSGSHYELENGESTTRTYSVELQKL